jgi:hypothetical protein
MNDIDLILYMNDGHKKVYRFTPAELRKQIHQCKINIGVSQCFGEDEVSSFYKWFSELLRNALLVLIANQSKSPQNQLIKLVNIEYLKLRIDIVEIASRYVNLRKSGRNFTGLCPFHDERHGSFTVYPESQSWYCFSCNHGGDVIALVQQIESIDFKSALNVLDRGIT